MDKLLCLGAKLGPLVIFLVGSEKRKDERARFSLRMLSSGGSEAIFIETIVIIIISNKTISGN